MLQWRGRGEGVGLPPPVRRPVHVPRRLDAVQLPVVHVHLVGKRLAARVVSPVLRPAEVKVGSQPVKVGVGSRPVQVVVGAVAEVLRVAVGVVDCHVLVRRLLGRVADVM